jgi:general secretion pathway protein J
MTGFSHHGRRHAGFTLVELLLAVSLMAMLLALAYGGLRAATRASERGQVLLEESGRVRAVHQFIRRQFNQIQPLPFAVSEDVETGGTVFAGSTRYVQFVAPMPGYLGAGGPQVQLLQIVPGENGDDLLFSHALLQEFEPERLFDREPIVLLEGLRGAEFGFLGRDDTGELSGWQLSWETPDQLPQALRLDIDFPEESQVIWPSLAAGIRVDGLGVGVATDQGSQTYQEAMRELMLNRGRKRD